jgi:hypothetical protein
MNIFFYTSHRSTAAKNYLKLLNELPGLGDITVLVSGSLFLSPLALKLRSGDLLILFAGDAKELDELLPLRNEFAEFRIILILADGECLRKAHLLHPCYIAFRDAKIIEIEAVIKKVTGKDKLLDQVYEEYRAIEYDNKNS